MLRSATAALPPSGRASTTRPPRASTRAALPWRRASSTSRPIPTSRCQSIPKPRAKCGQGVTTEIVGHCGFSVAPALPGKVELLRDYLSASAPWLPFKATTFADYLASFPATAVNAGVLVGHNTLRLMVMGMEDRPPTSAE